MKNCEGDWRITIMKDLKDTGCGMDGTGSAVTAPKGFLVLLVLRSGFYPRTF
jgi:hypothetical protein